MSPSTTLPQTNSPASISYSASASASDPTAQPNLPRDPTQQRGSSLSDVNPSSAHPAAQQTEVINAATNINFLAAHRRPSVDASSTQTSGLQGSPRATPIRRGNVRQNTPGNAGDVGEGAMGALGLVARVWRGRRKERGLGERIVKFLRS